MKSMMNRFDSRPLQPRVTAPLADNQFRELTDQESAAVSGGFWLRALVFLAETFLVAADHNGSGTGTLRALNVPE